MPDISLDQLKEITEECITGKQLKEQVGSLKSLAKSLDTDLKTGLTDKQVLKNREAYVGFLFGFCFKLFKF